MLCNGVCPLGQTFSINLMPMPFSAYSQLGRINDADSKSNNTANDFFIF